MTGVNSDGALAKLLPSIEKSRFLTEFWPHKDCWIHEPLSRFKEIEQLPMLENISALLTFLEAQKRTQVRVWFRTDDGIHNSILASPADAKKLYRTRLMTIVVDNVHQHVPILSEFMNDLASDLKTPLRNFGCNVYASPTGIGSRMHFDAEENFFFQIRGQKQWRFAPNKHVVNAPVGYMGEANIPRELTPLCTSFPTEMPEDTKTVVLKPGSVLFVPRGYWHESHTVEDSLALTLMFVSQSWKDILSAHLSRVLHLDEAWREPAAGLFSSDNRSGPSWDKYQALVRNLGARMIEPEELIKGAKGNPK